MTKLCMLLVGGGVGAASRYWITALTYKIFGPVFPYGTLVVNLIGCFLMGFVVVILDDKFHFTPHLQVLVIVGVLGAFTTFSTFIHDSAVLVREGKMLLAFANILLSVGLGFLVFTVGVYFGEQV